MVGAGGASVLKLQEPEIETTRDKLLACAEASILQKGFAATSIEELITTVGITKGGFFYHFRDKGELARALLDRYLDNEKEVFDELFKRADELNEDPLHGFLVFLKMFAEMMEDLPEVHPGCIIASYCYQERLFDDDIRRKTATSLLNWRQRFRSRLDLIAETYPPKIDVDFDGLADMVTSLVDGGIILSKVVQEKHVLPRQIELYRQFVKTIFLGTG
jgi:AcrR family transcriptional regulator